jgi:hypothetical protein
MLIAMLVIIGALWAWVLWKIQAFADSDGDASTRAFLAALAYPKILFALTVAALILVRLMRDRC